MKAKLHKMESGYILSLNGDIDDPYAIVNKELAEDYEWYKLSLKNCQAIELGYDLDELAKIEYPICEVWNDEEALIRELAFKKGFKKALEMMGDDAFNWLENKCYLSDDKNILKEEYNHQTEWDVEVEMDICGDKVYAVPEPNLDEDGCLILKRI